TRSTFEVKGTGWLNGLEVTGGGTGVVSHAGLVLLRALADRTGLTAGLSRALASRRLVVHDRGRVLADLACAIADGAEVISDFRVMGDQSELFGLVASVPTCWRGVERDARGGGRARGGGHRGGDAGRGAGRGAGPGRGTLPGGPVADRVRDGITCIGLDAWVVPAHWEKELAEPNFKGFGHPPLLAYCDNTAEPLAGKLRKGSAGSNTVADHLEVLGAAVAAQPSAYRRRLMETRDGTGDKQRHDERLEGPAARPCHPTS